MATSKSKSLREAQQDFAQEFLQSLNAAEAPAPVQPESSDEETVEVPEEASERASGAEDSEVVEEVAEAAVEEPSERAVPEEEVQQASEEESEPIQTLHELAEHLDVDLETLYGLKLEVTDGDESREFTLSDAKDAIQYGNEARLLADRLRKEREGIDQRRSELERSFNEQIAVAAEFVKQMRSRLEAEEKSIDWKSLKEEDPGQFAALKADFRERKEQLEEDIGNLGQAYKAAVDAASKEIETRKSEYVKEQQAKIFQLIPEWRNPEIQQNEASRLGAFLTREGFSPEEIKGLMDARVIRVARLAMLQTDNGHKVETVKKKVKSLPPRRVKPSAPAPVAPPSEAKARQLRGALKKTGKLKDAAALFTHQILGG